MHFFSSSYSHPRRNMQINLSRCLRVFVANSIHNEVQIHTSLCQQTNVCVAEDVGAELFVDIGEGAESSDGLVKHLDGRGDAFFVTEYKVGCNPFAILTPLVEQLQFLHDNIIYVYGADAAKSFGWCELEVATDTFFRIDCFVDVNDFFV